MSRRCRWQYLQSVTALRNGLEMENKQQNIAKTLARQNEEGRNFRSIYYEKVGFRGVEERKSLTKILSEKPIDLNKLLQFTQRFVLTTDYRLQCWKLLLEVETAKGDEWKEIEMAIKDEQKQVCAMLRNSLLSMLYIDANTSHNVVFVMMFLLEKGQLKYDVKQQMENSEMIDLIAIADNFNFIDTSFEVNYWLFRNFCIQKKDQRHLLLTMAEKFRTNLTTDDTELDAHLKSTFAIETLPIAVWFSRLYSGILHKDSLIKIFDKIIAGFYKVLHMTAKQMLITQKRDLLSLTSAEDIRDRLLMPLPFEISDVIVSKVLELCNLININ